MASKRCPRCDSIYPGWQPIHLACFFARLSFVPLIIISSVVLVALITVLRNLPDSEVPIQATVVSSSIAQITTTKSPTPSPRPTRTKSLPTRTSTLTPEPTVSILQAKIYTVGNKHVTLESTQAIEGEYRAVVDGMDYKCVKIKDYPNRLYCYGGVMVSGKKVEIKVFAGDSDDVVFEETFWAP